MGATFRRWAINRADFWFGVFTSLVLLSLALVIVFSASVRNLLSTEPALQRSIASAIITLIGTIALAIIVGTVKITVVRQSLTSLIASEIRAIQYGILTMDMFEYWATLFGLHPVWMTSA